MCGICGVFNFDGAPVDAASLDAMRDTLVHRGPDEAGAWIDAGVGLGTRRLSIIDLAHGQQPIWNEDRTIAVVFNGEIYNYPELRERLTGRGHRLRTQSDTEVIVHLYEDHGAACLAHLDGMFAFALWDARQQEMLLARDRLGEKPLVYFADDRRLVFASELKALAAAGVPREIDLEAAYHYFTLMSVPAPLTIFRQVRKLRPGHYLTCDRRGTLSVREYWDVANWTPASGKREPERLAELGDRLERSVRQRLISDVPLGALLSGGIDSSLMVALMSRLSSAPVKTFSVGFDDEGGANELPYARQVARHFGTDHHEIVVRPDVADLLPKLVWFWDEPFAVSSAVPTYLVSTFAREHVKVVITGDGGDEVFAGYPRYKWDRWADRAGGLGAMIGRRAEPVLGPLASRRRPSLRRMGRFLRSLTMAPDARYTYYVSKVDAREKRALFTPDLLAEFDRRGLRDSAVLDAAYRAFHGSDRLSRRLYGDLKTSLADEMLAKVDCMSMAASLEARPPLLDHHLVEFAATLPSSDKLRGGVSKFLLRRAAGGLLPAEILRRPKHGFEVPVGAWLRGGLKSFGEDVLFSARASSRGFWRPDAVRELWVRHQSGESGLGDRLWVLLNWELWCQVVSDTPTPSVARVETSR